jgi:8-oxo-dGTP diphosphatase
MPIRVVAAVIEARGLLLVCERPVHKRHGGLWEFPGGKVEPGESDLEAVARELEEELGVRTTAVGAVELSVGDPGSDFVIEFLPATIEGVPRPLEHASLQWVAADALLALPLAPGDRRYVRWRLGLEVRPSRRSSA